MNTSKYDFKDAPDGTTHFNPETDDVAACWVKIEGDDVYFQYAHNLITQEWRYWFSVKSRHCGHKALLDSFIEINPKETSQVPFVVGDTELASEEWKDGIPQVGTICEAQVKNGGGWREYEISFVGDEYMVIKDHIGETPIKYIYWEFRPIKTAEEIAAEEQRDKLVEFFVDYYGNPKGAESYLRLSEELIRKGWKND